MIHIAMITTKRKMPTIAQSVQSLRDAGFDQPIKIFAEPSKLKWYIPPLENVSVSYNPRKLGICKNSTFSIDRMFYDEKVEYVFIAQDDFIYAENTAEIIDEALPKMIDPNFWYLCLYTDRRNSREITKQWWNNLNKWWHTLWALYIFSRESREKIKSYPFYRQHVFGGKESERWDCCVAETTKLLGLDAWYHNPSLAAHIWRTSTVGHISHARITVKTWFREKKIDNQNVL